MIDIQGHVPKLSFLCLPLYREQFILKGDIDLPGISVGLSKQHKNRLQYLQFYLGKYAVSQWICISITICARYRPQFLCTQPLNALKSNGTLLPRPARYFRTPPVKGRGLGSRLSPWNLNRVSSIRTGPCETGARNPGAGDEPPLVSVYALGSSGIWGSCDAGRE